MPQDACSGLLASDPLISMLERAGIGRSSLIRVTGPSGLSALLWLCRHGFEQVGYVRSGQGSPHEAPDALLIAPTCDELALRRLLVAGPHVRDGGVLVFQSPLSATEDDQADPIHRLLARSGYEVEQCLHGRRRELHVARRLPHDLKKAA